MRKITTKDITCVGIMTAAVYVSSAFLQIPIPTAIGSTRLHMGNVMCLLSGLLLGPAPGGLAAGLGSMLFDLTTPAYAASAPFTFLFKFLMAWLCGKAAFGHLRSAGLRPTAGAALGAFTYVLLYLGKSFVEHRLLLGLPLEAVLLTISQKAAVSVTNAVISVIVTVPLGKAVYASAGKYLR